MRVLPPLPSTRTVRPLALAFWGRTWSLTAWCELRKDFRSFRLDRIKGLLVTDELFADEPGKTLPDFLEKMKAEKQE